MERPSGARGPSSRGLSLDPCWITYGRACVCDRNACGFQSNCGDEVRKSSCTPSIWARKSHSGDSLFPLKELAFALVPQDTKWFFFVFFLWHIFSGYTRFYRTHPARAHRWRPWCPPRAPRKPGRKHIFISAWVRFITSPTRDRLFYLYKRELLTRSVHLVSAGTHAGRMEDPE